METKSMQDRPMLQRYQYMIIIEQWLRREGLAAMAGSIKGIKDA
jgi:hypothetical protein